MFLSTGTLPKEIRQRVLDEKVIYASCVLSINALRDFHNKLISIVGGELISYSMTLEKATNIAIDRLIEKAQQDGWEGLHSIKIDSPMVADGASEILVIGTVFR